MGTAAMMVTATVSAPAAFLLVAVAAFVALLGACWLRSEPRAVRPGPFTHEPPGEEPPAVVALLTGDWVLPVRSVPATLIDLAARGLVVIERVADRTVVRLAARRRSGGVTSYEQAVLDHVAELAGASADREVPLEAFAAGGEAFAPRRRPRGDVAPFDRWWASFRDAVEDDARARGLSTSRWSSRVRRALLGASAVIGLAGTAVVNSLPFEPGSDQLQARVLATLVGAMAAAPAVAVALALGGERDTPAGREVAARWLGYRVALADDVLFREYPTAAVVVWDRHLAYGVAVGVAVDAAAGVPLVAPGGNEAWSSVGGRWRRVRIRREQWQVCRGRPPDLALAAGVAVGLVGAPFAVVGLALVPGVLLGVADGEPAGAAAFLLGAIVMLGGAAWGLATGGATIAAASADRDTGPVTVVGRVLRLSRVDGVSWLLTVDPGVVDTVPSWRVLRPVAAEVGDTVRVTVTPRLGHVTEVEVLDPTAPNRPPTPPVASADGDATPSPPPPRRQGIRRRTPKGGTTPPRSRRRSKAKRRRGSTRRRGPKRRR